VSALNASDFAKLDQAQVAFLDAPISSTQTTDACVSLKADQVAQLTLSAVEGLNEYCTENLGQGCEGISAAQWPHLSVANVVRHIGSECARYLTTPVLKAMSLKPDVQNLVGGAFGGFNTAQLEVFYAAWGNAFPLITSEAQGAAVNFDAIQPYKADFRNGRFTASITVAELATRGDHVSALQLASLAPSQVPDKTPLDWVLNMTGATFTGWREDAILQMPPAWFGRFSVEQLLNL